MVLSYFADDFEFSNWVLLHYCNQVTSLLLDSRRNNDIKNETLLKLTLTNLRSLSFTATINQVTNDSFRNLSNLTQLNIRRNSNLSDSCLFHTPNLIELTCNKKITDRALARVPKLETLVLPYPRTKITEAG